MSGSDTLDALYLALDDFPADQVTLLALADWYEEQVASGAADCLRWTVRHVVWPFQYHNDGGLTVSSSIWHDGWFWWAMDEPYHGRDWGHDANCRLPPSVWMKLRHTFDYDPAVFKEYPTRRAAYEALIDAWPLAGRAVVDRESAVPEAIP